MHVEIAILQKENWQDYKAIQLEALKNDPQAFGSKYTDWVNASDEKWHERQTIQEQ